MKVPTYKWVFVDESQDLNPVQIELIYRTVADNGRLVAVGDENQAIYAFRGADTAAMCELKEKFKCKRLPLSICYRCGKSIVKEAKKIVPAIEYNESQIDGEIKTVKNEVFHTECGEKDFVLCRTTAPLVQACLNFIREGRRAIVRGRDIGEGLINLISLNYKGNDLKEALIELDNYASVSINRWQKQNKTDLIINLQDRIDTIKVVASTCDTIEEVISKIRSIFDNNQKGITLCTVHRAKGLEAKNIWILKPELLPHPRAEKDWQLRQENNLKYVAITRAMEKLTWVLSE
jgi:superfamily I DNA/RNA helicase